MLCLFGLLWCVHRAWVFSLAIARCYLLLMCPLVLTAGRVCYTNASLRSVILQRGKRCLKRRKNEALRKVNESEELLQSQFCSFCCLCCWKERGIKSEAGLLLMSSLPCVSWTMRIFLSVSVIFGFVFLQRKVCCDTVQPLAWVPLPSLKTTLLAPTFTAVGMIKL